MLSNLSAHSQANFNGWAAAIGKIRVNSAVSLQADFQVRSAAKLERVQTILLRAGVDYHLTKRAQLTVGYAFNVNNRTVGDLDGFIPEHRIWQQILLIQKIKSVDLAHRLRLEQRFPGKTVAGQTALRTNGYDYANRVRYFVRSILPFTPKVEFKKGIYSALQNEVFMNFGNRSAVNGKYFDQNRFYAAIGYRASASFDIETGYMNQYINGSRNSFSINHLVQIATYLRL